MAGPEKNTGQGLLAVAVLGVLAILILPLPAFALDILLALNIGVSVLILLVALSLEKPLDFSVFPSLLLITTLFRLGLNVATTRLILLKGGEGAAAAGDVIETFGRFAIGGSVIVGAVIFLILLAVNFTVITRGSNRIAEVAARFTLDALPGKQMSIDADLAAGLIDERTARTRRQSLEREIEFFGAMDGASKFVRGDAVAGLVITVINIVGGLLAGLIRDHMSLATAVESFTILTIGDGLVSQMPALLVSTAAGIVVTRAGSGQYLGLEMGGQVFGHPKTLSYASTVLGVLAIIPGMPTIPFAVFSIAAFALARLRSRPSVAAKKAAEAAAESAKAPAPERMQDLLTVDAIELEVGHGLLRFIDLDKGGELPGRVTNLRRQIATDLGVVLPPVHLRDNLRLDPNEYRVRMRGVDVGKGIAHGDRVMVLDPSGGVPNVPNLQGISGKEPAFGLAALWIIPADRARAEGAGMTVVDPASVMTTHLSELIRRNIHELVGRQEVQELIAGVGKEAPKLVEDVIPGTVSLGEFVRVVRGVLREGLSVRDLRSILEGVADAAPRSKDTSFLVEQVRRRLFRQITAKVADAGGTVRAVTLDRTTEEALRRTLGQSDGEATLAPDIDTARKLVAALETRAARFAADGQPTVIIAPPDLRRPLFDFASRFVPDLSVVTARELVPGTSVEPVATIDIVAGSAIGRAA
ncbi:MAG TPA: flagellar biosynthesis protein FlhA [Polyangia bacterium]|nr:flagellar biosynthesis protein FlhA [Polyangia bacterium]